MLRLGHEIGSHTVTHPDMAQVGAEQARQELAESKQTSKRIWSDPCAGSRIPSAASTIFGPTCSMAFEAGYKGVVSGHDGLIRRGMAGQILPRMPVPSFTVWPISNCT